MFAYQEVINAVKGLAKSNHSKDITHCQLLALYSKNLGFQSYTHLTNSLTGMSSDDLFNVSLKLMRQICSNRLPTVESNYYEFWSFTDGGFGYYSHWVGWDSKGQEVRVPRPLIATPTVIGLRKDSDNPIYVVESEKEVICWRHKWKGIALIPEALAQECFKLSFEQRVRVSKTPPMDLVRRNAAQYIDNIMRE